MHYLAAMPARLLLLLTLLLPGLSAAAFPLTFRVDLHGHRVSAAGVHVAGDFQTAAGFPTDWNPATTALTDADGDSIYETTVQVPAGTYGFKFINGDAWGADEQVPAEAGLADGAGHINRQVALGMGLTAAGLRLPVVPFGGAAPAIVRFAVKLTGQTVSPEGLYVTGNWQTLAGYGPNWTAAATPLTDPDQDGTYEALIALPAPGLFQFKFVNGATWAGAEAVPVACGVDDGAGNINRVLNASVPVNAQPALCFGSCTACGAPTSSAYPTYWWNDAVFYEIFVRSFFDSGSDGRGDFNGLTAKLDYLNDGNPATTTDLGVTALWLMPMMASPSYHGYDVTDYKAVEPDYGTMAQFEAFLAAAHARGIKVIIDLVLNHSSNQHPWFQQAASSPTNARRDWFRWAPTNPGYQGPWGQNVWHQRNNAWYYGLFYDGMPDLNWQNPDLKAAMWDATSFWLRKGVDGYRLDAVKYLIETGRTLENTPQTLALLEEFGDTVRANNPQAFTVGEAWSNSAAVVPYVQNGRLDACFEFDQAGAILNSLNAGNAAGLRTQLNLVNTVYPKLQFASFLTNHDQNRVFDQLGASMPKMKQAAALLLTLPGVPFLYYGEEVAMNGSGPDENKRRPMQWTAGSRAGFTTGNPWMALNPNYAQFNVATMAADPTSLLNHYKKLIGLRTASEALRKGYYLPVTVPGAALLAYARVFDQAQEAVVVVANLGGTPAAAPTLALPISSLPAGTYFATDLYTNQMAGTVTLDGQGGFSGWTPALGALAANGTWMLRLSTSPTGVAPAAPAFLFALYPNPATTRVRIELPAPLPAAQLSVYDLNGRQLQETTISSGNSDLDISLLPNGVYFVRVTVGLTTTVQRLVVAR